MAVSAFQEWLDSFTIFDKYMEGARGTLFAEEGNIWAGPSRDVVSDEDNAALEALGWEYDEKHECYFHDAQG